MRRENSCYVAAAIPKVETAASISILPIKELLTSEYLQIPVMPPAERSEDAPSRSAHLVVGITSAASFFASLKQPVNVSYSTVLLSWSLRVTQSTFSGHLISLRGRTGGQITHGEALPMSQFRQESGHGSLAPKVSSQTRKLTLRRGLSTALLWSYGTRSYYYNNVLKKSDNRL